MAVALDANLLLHAANRDSRHHASAESTLRALIEEDEVTYLFWPVILAFVRIATHPGVFRQPLAYEQAVANVEQLLRSPTVRSPSESVNFWRSMRSAADRVNPRGNLWTDAHIVALMKEHGVRTIITNDRDFRKFDGIRVVDPFSS